MQQQDDEFCITVLSEGGLSTSWGMFIFHYASRGTPVLQTHSHLSPVYTGSKVLPYQQEGEGGEENMNSFLILDKSVLPSFL